jgi:hypothetical protein
MQNEATPTPWEVDENGDIMKHWCEQKRFRIARMEKPAYHEDSAKGWEEARANAAYIVRAVNMHEELVNLAAEFEAFQISTYSQKERAQQWLEMKKKARAVLAKCGESQKEEA